MDHRVRTPGADDVKDVPATLGTSPCTARGSPISLAPQWDTVHWNTCTCRIMLFSHVPRGKSSASDRLGGPHRSGRGMVLNLWTCLEALQG